MPGTSGAISTPARMPASVSARTAEPLKRMRGARLERRHASSSTVGTLMQTVQRDAAATSCKTSMSRTTIGPFVTMPTGVPRRGELDEAAPR